MSSMDWPGYISKDTMDSYLRHIRHNQVDIILDTITWYWIFNSICWKMGIIKPRNMEI